MTKKNAPRPIQTIADVIASLTASGNVCDIRKAADLRELVTLIEKSWRGLLEIIRLGSLPEGGLAVVCRLHADGLVWSDGQPARHDVFVCVLGVLNSYPLAPPTVQFLDPVPWCGHVVHRDFLPDASQLPTFLQEYRRQGHGRCCYIRSAQWRANAGTLALAIWQISRLVTLTKDWGEAGSLNPTARDYAQRLAKEGGHLPLGRPLPYPHENDPVGAAVAEGARENDGADIDWISESGEGAK